MTQNAATAPSPTRSLSIPLAALRGVLPRHYLALGERSRWLRFLARADDDHLAHLADEATPDEVLTLEIEGVVRGVLEIYDAGGGHAEIGLSLEDAWQGKGYGRRLFEQGLAAARARGARTADLFFSSENTGVRRLVQEQGGSIVRRGADCEAEVALQNQAAG